MTTIIVIGCNHSSAPLSLVERLAVPHAEADPLLAALAGVVPEAMVLSTCNRVELYAVAHDVAGAQQELLCVLARRAGIAAEALRPHAYVHTGEHAIRHALSTASGLDSMILGEDQIQSQWKRAVERARAAGALGPMLERLGASALACGKRVRSSTGIARHAVSLESLAVRAAVERLGSRDLTGRNVIVIGAGQSAGLLVKHLQATGSPAITVMTRSLARAQGFAGLHCVTAASIDELSDGVASADVVVCCTSAPHAVLHSAHFHQRRDGQLRPPRPLVCIDLGVPRDVDDDVAAVEGVTLIRLAELADLAAHHREERRSHLPAARAIVASEGERLVAWIHVRANAAAVARLSRHARDVAEKELAAALARLPELTEHERRIVATLAHRLAGKLMHVPITDLRARSRPSELRNSV